jgi:hypothetical protein
VAEFAEDHLDVVDGPSAHFARRRSSRRIPGSSGDSSRRIASMFGTDSVVVTIVQIERADRSTRFSTASSRSRSSLALHAAEQAAREASCT